MELLEYENQLFLDLFHEDGLVIVAKGLGIERLLLSLIKIFNDPGNLVLIIGTYTQEEEYFLEQLALEDISPLPKVVTNEYGTNERHSVYMQGGVLFVTSRILVVDMLMDRVPFELVTGIIVYKAHKIIESCQEAFILRLFRQKNQKGFVKALSSSPYSFTQGFCQVQRIMRNLFVKKLYLWPRFHAVVTASLEKHQSNVVEIHVSLTPTMRKIQLAILDIMGVTVKEIKKINPSIDTEEITVENSISKSFDKVIKYQLDPVWHQLGNKTKRLISDLKTLRVLLSYLTQYDAVTFYFLVKSIRDNVEVNTQISDWLFLNAADTVFICAKERIFGPETKSGKDKSKLRPKAADVEVNPKWIALAEIIADLEKEFLTPQTVLIIVEDERTSSQLQELLDMGPNSFLRKLFNRNARGAGFLPILGKKYDKKPNPQPPAPKRGKLSRKRTEIAVNSDNDNKDDLTQESDDDNDCDEEEILNKTYNEELLKINFFVLRGTNRPFGFKEKLDDLKPKNFIMYDVDIGIVRQLEVYQSLNLECQLKIYFIVYGGSAEEQRYLTSLRKEKEAFEYLIREKSSMVVPEGGDGKTGDHPDLERGTSKANETISTRKAGGSSGANSNTRQLVIVDAREFRSELPALIHRRGIDIEPVTIEVGDYILTPDLCVERKSLSDLIGSLNNGRLYNQANSMCRYYKRPVLLIEFDQSKSFSLQGKYFSSTKESSTTLMSKLILLFLHFSRLRMLWSPSPYATAEMFEMLKMNKEQPTAEQALKVTAQATQGDLVMDKYNAGPQDFLSKLPGVNTKNIRRIMNSVKSLYELMALSEETLAGILENSKNANILWEALHKKSTVKETQNIGSGSATGTRGTFSKKGYRRFKT